MSSHSSGARQWWEETGREQLSELLFWRWDPIGVSDDFPASRGEYASYVEGIGEILLSVPRPLLRVEGELERVERDEMGLPHSSSAAAKRRAVAREIYLLRVKASASLGGG